MQHWIFRLQNQLNTSKVGLFVTLTYDEVNIKVALMQNGNREVMTMKEAYENKLFGKPTLHKRDYQLFLKKLRKALPNRVLKYVICGEYGGKTNRPHYHVILFGITLEDYNILHSAWGMGNVHVGTITDKSIAYTFKYSTKGDVKKRHYLQTKQFIDMSQGLGEEFAFDITYKPQTHQIKKTYINKETAEVKTVEYTQTRLQKIRTIKSHFQTKLKDLVNKPYYSLLRGQGHIKMSVPRFYLKAANYDSTTITELYQERLKTQWDNIHPKKREIILLRMKQQHERSRQMQEQAALYSVSKEKI